ncbi:glycosyltransferase family 4 protein [Mariniflexile gromovii]|uniref:Glycosyltransferase family 4 protein n=1 Tax=Mariniflexile gromovii TaxID=362523 RepID=A0ABS4BWW2_9FLAO|nr:glycosyltransferase family 4 protein [Mariniflexile gromovii]MBP0904525.1 glycosyltransferase family 4 protein [Mariniflexile gromovii]
MAIKNKKSIVIIGLIDNIGGREIEARNIIEALSKKYNVRVISLFFMTGDSEAVKGLNCNWTNIYYQLNKSNIFLQLISFLVKVYHKKKTPSYFMVDNRINRKLFNLNTLKNNILKKEIDKADAVLYCGTLHLNILNEMVKYCDTVKKPIVLRTTGKIKSIPDSLKKLVPLVNTILVHSINNASLLKKYNSKNIQVIDQTTLQEKNLLGLPIQMKKELIFGFLGRFSEEKGVIDLLKVFNNLDKKLILSGSGPLLKDVEKLITPNITFLGTISPEKLTDYFKQIDVLIIPSFEEAGPLVGIEAMAAGKVILSTKVGAMMDRLSKSNNNFWFDINKKETLINQIYFLSNIDQNELVRIRETTRQHYIGNYSVQKISKSYLEVFDKLLY